MSNTLKLLAIGLSGLLVLLVVIGLFSGGLPDYAIKNFREQENIFQKKHKKASNKIKEIRATLKRHKNYLGPIAARENWQERLKAIEEEFQKGNKIIENKASELIKKDNSDDRPKLALLNQKLRKIGKKQEAALELIYNDVQAYAAYKESHEKYYQKAKATYQGIRDYSLDQVKTKIAQGRSDWPQKDSYFRKKLKLLQVYKNSARKQWQTVQNEFKKPEGKKNYMVFGQAVQDLQRKYRSLKKEDKGLQSRVDQLYYSMSRVLEDMKKVRSKKAADIYKDSKGIAHMHKYRVVKVYQDGRRKKKVSWYYVKPSIYKQHKNHAGMTVYHKKLGQFISEGKYKASPPGYNYVGDKRYGRWERGPSGQSMWAWYGQYAFMRSMFWGRSYYSPINRSDYNTYRSYRNRNKTYYGRTSSGKKKYGTTGTYTRKRYSSSRYVRSRNRSHYRSSSSRRSYRSYRSSSYSGSRYSGSYGK